MIDCFSNSNSKSYFVFVRFCCCCLSDYHNNIMAQACRPMVFWGQSREYVYIKVDISEITSVSNYFNIT